MLIRCEVQHEMDDGFSFVSPNPQPEGLPWQVMVVSPEAIVSPDYEAARKELVELMNWQGVVEEVSRVYAKSIVDAALAPEATAKTIEVGYWCEAEGLYFTDLSEHHTERTWRKRGCGPLGHYGYECEGRKTTLKVAVVSMEDTQ